MRTTITVDDELLRQAKRAAVQSGRSLSEVVGDALREMFMRRQATPRKRIRLTTAGRNSKVLPGVDFSDNASVWAILTEAEIERLFGQNENSGE
ncbi:MAG: type II toxin-antitoxin system VapB family antitoxin [Dehalococcoidia bacterium]